MESSVYQELVDRLNRIEQYDERTTHLLQDIDDELEMSTRDLIDTLDVSEGTLYRWRKKNIVRFRYTESGDVRYFYKSLLICARYNRLRISGMRNDELLERLLFVCCPQDARNVTSHGGLFGMIQVVIVALFIVYTLRPRFCWVCCASVGFVC